MKLEVLGMEELIDKLNKYHEAPKKAGNTALKNAAEVMLKGERETLLRMHKKDRSTGKGAANLKVGGIKTYASGSKFVGIGFTKEKMSGANWDDIKGAYFNNYGWYNNRGGKYVAGSNWMGVAFENSHNECYRIIKDSLMAELRKID